MQRKWWRRLWILSAIIAVVGVAALAVIMRPRLDNLVGLYAPIYILRLSHMSRCCHGPATQMFWVEISDLGIDYCVNS